MGIYTHWALVPAWAYDLKAARPSRNNDIIDSRHTFLENRKS